MLSQLSAINSDIVFDDYFHRATVRYVTGTFFETTPLIYVLDRDKRIIAKKIQARHIGLVLP